MAPDKEESQHSVSNIQQNNGFCRFERLGVKRDQ